MAGETTEVLMPLMGEGITEATLVRWLKKPGDLVRKEEPLLEVSTDKVDTEIPAPAAGVLLQTFAVDGETVAVNKVIAILAEAGTAAVTAIGKSAAEAGTPAVTAAGKSAAAAPAPGTPPAAKPTAVPGQPVPADARPPVAGATAASSPAAHGASVTFDAGRVGDSSARRSSPLVRKMARAQGIDLANVEGSGLQGRITKRDLEGRGATASAAASGQATPFRTTSNTGAAGATGSTGPAHLEYGRLPTRAGEGGRELLDGVPVRREKMTKMRSLIAEHMVRSVRTSPHVTTVFEIDMHKVVHARDRARSAFQAREGFNLTYTPFFLHAAVQAIKAHPIVNVSVDGDDVLWKDQINLGVAVAIDSGLIVPVIRNAGELNVTGIARRLNDLATRARMKKLLPEDVQGGTFSVTNPGMFGSIVSAPIINQPQVAILSLGAIVKRPVVIHDLIGIRPMVQVGLTFDHRVVDGEGGARWLATFKEILESFDAAGL